MYNSIHRLLLEYLVYFDLTFNFVVCLLWQEDETKTEIERERETEFEIETENFIISGSNLLHTDRQRETERKYSAWTTDKRNFIAPCRRWLYEAIWQHFDFIGIYSIFARHKLFSLFSWKCLQTIWHCGNYDIARSARTLLHFCWTATVEELWALLAGGDKPSWHW